MTSKLYTRHAAAYNRATRNNIFNALYERPSLRALLGDVAEKTVLDLGCGSGPLAEELLEAGARHVTCVDASAEMIALVERNLGGRVRAYAQDLSEGLPREAEGSAPIAICSLLIHYLEDLKAFFREIHRVLEPGGSCVLSTHHPFADLECSPTGDYFKRERVRKTWDTIGEPVEVAFYRRPLSELTEAVTSSGLVISRLTEGVVSDEIAKRDARLHELLRTQPNFLFLRCEKPISPS